MPRLRERYRKAQPFVWPPPIAEKEEGPIPAPPPVPDPLASTVVGTAPDGAAVELSARELCEHMLVLGKTGEGKSTFIKNRIEQDIFNKRSFMVIDPHRTLIEDTLRLIPPEREADVILVDLADAEWPFGLNLFQAPADAGIIARTERIDQLIQAFKKVWGGTWGITIEEWLKVIAVTFAEHGEGTMAAIPTLLGDAAFRAVVLRDVHDPFALAAWRRVTNPKTGELYREQIEPTLRRISLFMMNPVLTNVVGQARSTIDLGAAMAAGKIVLVHLPARLKETVHLLGTVIVQLLLNAAFARPVGATPVYAYIDECQYFLTPDMRDIIMGVRKHGVGLCLATQALANLDNEAVREAVLAVGSIVCYTVTADDARTMARELRRGVELPGDVWAPPNKTEVANRLANLRGLLGRGSCILKCPHGEYAIRVPLPTDLPVDGRASRDGIIARSRAAYCRPRREVEAEIRASLSPAEQATEDAPQGESSASRAAPGRATRRRRWIEPPPDTASRD